MKKNNLIIIILVIAIVLVAFFIGNKGNLTDAEKFKKEYESLNSEKSTNNKKYRSIEISNKNPIVYATAEEIVEKMENKESFAVYFGFNKCPWCRSVIPSMLEVAKDLNIETIYYVDVLDIRNTYELNDNNEPVEAQKGSEGYYKLVEKFADYLEDYTLTDNTGNSINTNTKRIYAPNIAAVLGGNVRGLTTGISSKQSDAYEDLTKDLKTEMYNKIKCTLECLNENNTVCESKAC